MSRKGNKIGNIMMRLDDLEKEALRFAIKGFKGKVFLFGSRSNDKKRGGDIDIMLYPKQQNTNPVKLSLDVQARFFSICEQKLDVIIYKKDNIFCKEILKNAKPINIKTI